MDEPGSSISAVMTPGKNAVFCVAVSGEGPGVGRAVVAAAAPLHPDEQTLVYVVL